MNDPCSICGRFERYGRWSVESQLPPGLAKLVDAGGGLSRCPECGRYFRYVYEQEWADSKKSESWALSRLTPSETEPLLSGDALAQFRTAFPSTISRLQAELKGKSAATRDVAAFDLASLAIAKADWPALSELIDSESTCGPALKASWEAATRGADLNAVVDPMRRRLTGAHREAASGALIVGALNRGEAVLVAELLASPHENVVAAAVQWIRVAFHEAKIDVAPYVEGLKKLIAHPSRMVRDEANHALQILGSRRLIDPLPLWIELLPGSLGKEAEGHLGFFSKHYPAAAVEPFSRLLADEKTRRRACEALVSLSARVDIGDAVPAALDAIRAGSDDCVEMLLAAAATKRLSLRKFLPDLVPLLDVDKKGWRRWMVEFLQLGKKRCLDLEFARPHLQRAADDPKAARAAAALLAQVGPGSANVEWIYTTLSGPANPGRRVALETLVEAEVDPGPYLDRLIDLLSIKLDGTNKLAQAALVGFHWRYPAHVLAAVKGRAAATPAAEIDEMLVQLEGTDS